MEKLKETEHEITIVQGPRPAWKECMVTKLSKDEKNDEGMWVEFDCGGIRMKKFILYDADFGPPRGNKTYTVKGLKIDSIFFTQF